MVLALTASCQEKASEDARFEVIGLESSYNFAADLNQSETFKVISDNVMWEIDLNGGEWLTVSPMRSLGGYNTVTITPQNNSSGARSCTMRITADNGFEKSVTINQAGK